MKKIWILGLILAISMSKYSAKEGMWLPLLLKSLNESDMHSMGLKLSADDIYSINQSSLKDAIVSFGGFCTGEVISDKGLLLTNHHCGYRQIQSHSSVENDLLTDGFWAKNHGEELKNPGLTATFIVRMEDVSEAVLDGLDGQSESMKQKKIAARIDSLVKLNTEGSEYGAYIRPFYYGLEYYMFITETFEDVRLVGAPPSSIGKFGGDTDNWMWPRHTGDFSMFRIYANKDNKPAVYAEENVPYTPKKHLPISIDGVEEGDFTMVFGFPGRTQEYLTSYAITQIKEVLNPAMINIRDKSLKIMDRHMQASDMVRIQYASKYASISNYWKKWIGENRGLQKANAIELKRQKEEVFVQQTHGMAEYDGLMETFEQKYKDIEPYALARSYWIEVPYRKLEFVNLASKFRGLVNDAVEGKEIDASRLQKSKNQIEAHFKDYDMATDLEISMALSKMYRDGLSDEFVPASMQQSDAAVDAVLKKIFEKSLFVQQEKLAALMENFSGKTAKKLAADPAYQLMDAYFDVYFEKVRPSYSKLSAEIDSLSKIYVDGLRKHVPLPYYPDANSTLRLAYGKVEPFKPSDAVDYDFTTNTEGILEKYNPEQKDFVLPARLIELIEKGDYGQYKNEDGSMTVCFIASNHTTGGNSGSPVINAYGELIGLNFDRNWEGTMSDINYDIDQCRNIAVDIRYVLFVVDKFAGASHFIDELTLVKASDRKTEEKAVLNED